MNPHDNLVDKFPDWEVMGPEKRRKCIINCLARTSAIAQTITFLSMFGNPSTIKEGIYTSGSAFPVNAVIPWSPTVLEYEPYKAEISRDPNTGAIRALTAEEINPTPVDDGLVELTVVQTEEYFQKGSYRYGFISIKTGDVKRDANGIESVRVAPGSIVTLEVAVIASHTRQLFWPITTPAHETIRILKMNRFFFYDLEPTYFVSMGIPFTVTENKSLMLTVGMGGRLYVDPLIGRVVELNPQSYDPVSVFPCDIVEYNIDETKYPVAFSEENMETDPAVRPPGILVNETMSSWTV